MSEGRKLILYPSNWLYNAGVIGFLKVLEFGGENIKNFFKDDGSIEIEISVIKKIFEDSCEKPPPLNKLKIWHWHYVESSFKWSYSSLETYITSCLQQLEKGGDKNTILKKIIDKNFNFDGITFDEEVNKVKEIFKKKDWNFDYLVKNVLEIIKPKESFYIYRKSIGSLFTKGGFYQNLFNPSQFKKLEKFVEKFKYENIFDPAHNDQCHFCGSKFYKTFPLDFQYFSFLFPAQSFINTYWNLNPNNITRICSFCKFILAHSHLGLTKTENSTEVFINANSFKLIWDLNKFAEEILQKQKEYGIRKLLGTSFIQWAIKRRTLLGAWTMMNIEVIIKKKGIIDYFDLPYHITRILLDYEIAGLINRIGEEKIFDLVLSGKFDEIEKANYYVLKAFLKLKNNEKLSDNDPVTKYVDNYKDRTHLSKISNLLPELYAKIIRILKTEVKYV